MCTKFQQRDGRKSYEERCELIQLTRGLLAQNATLIKAIVGQRVSGGVGESNENVGYDNVECGDDRYGHQNENENDSSSDFSVENIEEP